MLRLAVLLACLAALPATAQRLDRPMNLAPVEALPQLRAGGIAPMPDRALDRPRGTAADTLPRVEATLLGQRDSASASAFAPGSPGAQGDRLTRMPVPALRLTVPFSD